MPSSKGTPTDPKLREELKEKVKNQPNSDGQGKGQWSAWKATKLSKEYEKHGGGYENEPGSKNEPTKGPPEPKGDGKKQEEMKEVKSKPDGDSKNSAASNDAKEKPKANTSKKASTKDSSSKQSKSKTEKKAPAEGSRRSARVSAKRDADAAGATSTNGGKKQKAASKN